MSRMIRRESGRRDRRAGRLIAVGVIVAVVGFIAADEPPAIGTEASRAVATPTSVAVPPDGTSPPPPGAPSSGDADPSGTLSRDEHTMAEALGFVFSMSMGGVNLPQPDAECFAEELGDLPPGLGPRSISSSRTRSHGTKSRVTTRCPLPRPTWDVVGMTHS